MAGVESVLPRVSTARTRDGVGAGLETGVVGRRLARLEQRAVERALEHERERRHDGLGIGRRCRRGVVAAGEGHQRRRLGEDAQRRARRDRGLRLDDVEHVGPLVRRRASGRAGRRDRWRRRRARRTCARRAPRPSGPASSRMLSGLTQSTNSTGLVVSRPHSNVSTPGGVKSSVPWNSNISWLVLSAGSDGDDGLGRLVDERFEDLPLVLDRFQLLAELRAGGEHPEDVLADAEVVVGDGAHGRVGSAGRRVARHERAEVERALVGRVGRVVRGVPERRRRLVGLRRR